MTASMNPFIRLLEIPDEVERIKLAIVDLIDNLPENPAIHRLNKNCFTISSKDLCVKLGNEKTGLNSNWTTFYHDFKQQAEFIKELIQEFKPEFIIPTLKRIVTNQSIYYKGQSKRFHPMFCNHLRSLIEAYGINP
jgi:hypothetical protein